MATATQISVQLSNVTHSHGCSHRAIPVSYTHLYKMKNKDIEGVLVMNQSVLLTGSKWEAKYLAA